MVWHFARVVFRRSRYFCQSVGGKKKLPKTIILLREGEEKKTRNFVNIGDGGFSFRRFVTPVVVETRNSQQMRNSSGDCIDARRIFSTKKKKNSFNFTLFMAIVEF